MNFSYLSVFVQEPCRTCASLSFFVSVFVTGLFFNATQTLPLTNRTISQLIPSAVSLRIAETELHQVKRMIGGIGNVLFLIYSQTENCVRSKGFFPVCRLKTPPCVHSKRPRVIRQHAHMLKSMRACCRITQGRFECTHGDVLNLHTGVFSVPHHTAHTQPRTTTPQTTPQTPHALPHTTEHNITHNITPRQRQRNKTEREDRESEEKKKMKIRQDKTR